MEQEVKHIIFGVRFTKIFVDGPSHFRRVLANPGVQGSLQAFEGLMEAGVDASAALGLGGVASVPGWLIMAHGLDQFTTGMNTVLSGRYHYRNRTAFA